MEFLRSMVDATLTFERPMLTHHLIKGLNSHAIAGLHAAAGQYRSTSVSVGNYIPPEHARVQSLMDYFLEDLDEMWGGGAATTLGAFALWSINHIHPFVNGNGRTARAFCYYIMCVKLGSWLPGSVVIPIRLREPQYRTRYIECLQTADDGDLQPLDELLTELLTEQLQT